MRTVFLILVVLVMVLAPVLHLDEWAYRAEQRLEDFLLPPVENQVRAGMKKCCACRSQDGARDGLFSETGDACRARAEQGVVCQETEIPGDSCQPYTVKLARGRSECLPRRVILREADGPHELALAETVRQYCNVYNLIHRDGLGTNSPALAEAEGDPPARNSHGGTAAEAKGESVSRYWTCGADVQNGKGCRASLFDGNTEIYSVSKNKGSTLATCDPEICSNLFESEFSKLSDTYIHDRL